jgi:hypothetical protein
LSDPVGIIVGMTEEERTRLGVLMARMAETDPAAPFALYQEFGHVVAAVMRRHLQAVGTNAVSRQELDGLTMDACLELADCARAWRPDGGALPWNWAGARLRALAARFVGTYAEPIDDRDVASIASAETNPGGAEEPHAVDLLQRLAVGHPMAALLRDALVEVATPRDQLILLESRLQGDLGDPSPSHTVAAELGVHPDTVRQAASRVRKRLRELAERDERYAALGDLPLVA